METHLRQSGDKTPRTAVLLVASGVLLAWPALFARYFPSSAGRLGRAPAPSSELAIDLAWTNEKVAEVIEDLELDYAVLTSVNRDDLPDQGSAAFASTIEAIDRRLPTCRVEGLAAVQGKEICASRLQESSLQSRTEPGVGQPPPLSG